MQLNRAMPIYDKSKQKTSTYIDLPSIINPRASFYVNHYNFSLQKVKMQNVGFPSEFSNSVSILSAYMLLSVKY